jgi:DNA-binding MarR family transcriptional regulator
MKQSLKSQILEEVRLRQYCPLDIIHELARKGGYKQSTSEKKCRELCEDGYITTLYNEKGYVRAYIPIYNEGIPLIEETESVSIKQQTLI